MRIRTILGEILPVLGTIGLLGLWLYQQTGIEHRSGELQRLANARAVYQTYQSNNALFNAFEELPGKSKGSSSQIRVFQMYNYELGLSAIEGALPESDRIAIPPTTDAYDPLTALEARMAHVQERLEKLQQKLDEREETVRQLATNARKNYLELYVMLSTVMILGAICKVFDKLSIQSSSKS